MFEHGGGKVGNVKGPARDWGHAVGVQGRRAGARSGNMSEQYTRGKESAAGDKQRNRSLTAARV